MQQIRRHRERSLTEREQLDQVLDDIRFATLSTVLDGAPWVVPMLFARDGDRLLLHGSTGAGALRHVADGAPAALCVTALDGIVVAHSTFDSSANYRAAVVTGRLTPLAGEEQWHALERLAERLIPGRTAEVRPMTDKETAATLAMALPITDGHWTVKVRTGPPGTPEEPTDAWCGTIPIHPAYGPAVPAPWTAPDRALPASVQALQARS